jgi:hypothetical protein
VWDGDTATFFDGHSLWGSVTGIVLDAPVVIAKLDFVARFGYKGRALNGMIQGATSKDGPWTTLHTVSLAASFPTVNEVEISAKASFSALRLL